MLHGGYGLRGVMYMWEGLPGVIVFHESCTDGGIFTMTHIREMVFN